MAFEPAVIEQWIYDTLTGDATLMGLLAPDNKPNGFQMGIYNTIAPQIDPISRKQPTTPYVVFDRAGNGGAQRFAVLDHRDVDHALVLVHRER